MTAPGVAMLGPRSTSSGHAPDSALPSSAFPASLPGDAWAASFLEDVVVELGGVEHSDPAAAGADDAGPLEIGEEAADALPRGAGELGQVCLVHADRHLAVFAAAGSFRDQLGEDAGDATRHRLEGLA